MKILSLLFLIPLLSFASGKNLILGASVSDQPDGAAQLVAKRWSNEYVHQVTSILGLTSTGIWKQAEVSLIGFEWRKFNMIIAFDLFFHDLRKVKVFQEYEMRRKIRILCENSKVLILGEVFNPGIPENGGIDWQIDRFNHAIREQAEKCDHAVVMPFKKFFRKLDSSQGITLDYVDPPRTIHKSDMFDTMLLHPNDLGKVLLANEILLSLNKKFRKNLELYSLD